MDFNFTEEQSMVRDTVASFLQDNYDFDDRAARSVASDSGWRADVLEGLRRGAGHPGRAVLAKSWAAWAAAPIENMIIMEEFGKALVIEPYLGTVVIGGGFTEALGLRRRGDR